MKSSLSYFKYKTFKRPKSFIKDVGLGDPSSAYRLNPDGVTKTFVGKQFDLWKFFAHGILPYEKSTIKNSDWVLVGHGLPYESCGDVIGLKCDNVSQHEDGKIFRRYLKYNCHRRECPVCYESWGSIEAERSLIRLASYVFGVYEIHRVTTAIIHRYQALPSAEIHKLIVSKLDSMVKKAVHVVVSLDPKTVLTKISYPGTRSKVVRVLKRAGLHSGALIFHEKRYHCAKCDSPIPDYHKECPICGEKTFVWVSSPHFHAIGFGWIRGSGDIFKKFGWIVVNLKQRRSVYATFQYVLSHATYFVDPSPKGKPVSFHITTWFGRLAYNQMRSIPRLYTIRPVCPYCGMLLMRMEDEELNGFPPPVEFDRYLETFL